MLPAIHIDPALLERCPHTRLGCLAHMVTVEESREDLQTYLGGVIAPFLRHMLETTPLADIPNLRESRAAYKAFGKDPGRCRISSEALYRRIRQGKELYRINSIVDANNLASLETGFSIGSYDLNAISGDIVLRLGREGEAYAGIGKDSIDLCHLPLLADEQGPFGGATSDSTRAMITATTAACLTVIYGFSTLERLEEALALTAGHFAAYTQSRPLVAPFVVQGEVSRS
ncbi:phenylalanine--tRNA ligase beta subunit-related protein [uncultured Desulfovibrio sp.]|uniref:B3/B4 domain-containing protein n=1 Tax=uncultured Desulfovibrio sp. TaxID=167968 RepID=UPI0025DA9D56|nr:phenylalanine--tRNA ligase beta subunit-related protein [uncultured Desulfovibrio sp.]